MLQLSSDISVRLRTRAGITQEARSSLWQGASVCQIGVLAMLAGFLLGLGAAVAKPATVEGETVEPEVASDDETAERTPDDEQAGEASTDEKPLWEIGVVGGGGWLPDYPASSDNHFRGIALPYAIYRGDFLRLGDRGIARGILADQERVELDLGVDASFPVDSSDNDARDGMSDLDYLLELGPRITFRILPKSHRDDLDLALATRAVISTDVKNWRYQGINVNPSLTYRRNDMFGQDLSGVLSVGSLFGLDGLNNYFYRVSPADERTNRPRYNADDGYIGTELTAGFSWGIIENVRVFGGVQVGYWNHAENEDSPLHRQNTTIAVGGGLRWSFFVSEETVPD